MIRLIPISQYYYKKNEIDAFLNGKSNNNHVHGNINNNGTINYNTDTVNNIVVTDSSNVVKTVNKLPADKITHQDISGKVNISDIKDNLTSTDTNKPLSANQGKELKTLVDTHVHGSVNNNGTITANTDTVNKIVVTDANNAIKSIGKLPADKVTHQDISGKVNISDIKDNLTSTDTNKPLSANQGKALKTLVDTHVHGNINNDGTVTTTTNSVNNIIVTDSSNVVKSINKLPADKVTHQDISGKVNVSDIKDNLTSTDTDKPLSAKQGKELKTLVDTKANSNDVYSKSQTMSASDIRQAIADGVGNIDIFEVVSELPTSNIKGNKFYLTPNGENIEKNVYDINIYVDNNWETIDSLEFDISNYPTTSEVTILLNDKVDKIEGKGLSKNDFTDELKNKLENQVLTQHQSLTNYVQKSQTQGLIKNDGTIDTNQYLTQHQSLTNYVQKSQTQGLIQNDGTIDTNEYLTKETAPKSFNYGFIDSNLILHLMYLGTEFSVTKTIMQSGDNNPITVIIVDEDGNPLEDMPVEFYINGTKVGQTINTDSNGAANYTYQGNGSGKIDLQVKVGNFVSETYEVIDALWYDEAIDGHENSDLWIDSNLSKTASSDGTTISNNDSYSLFFGLNKYGTTATDVNQLYDWTENKFVLEADIISFSGTVILQIIDTPISTHLYQKTVSDMIGVSATNKHLKIVANGTDVRCYVDGVENTSMKVTTAFAETLRIVFRMDGESSIKFRNLVYYPI